MYIYIYMYMYMRTTENSLIESMKQTHKSCPKKIHDAQQYFKGTNLFHILSKKTCCAKLVLEMNTLQFDIRYFYSFKPSAFGSKGMTLSQCDDQEEEERR